MIVNDPQKTKARSMVGSGNMIQQLTIVDRLLQACEILVLAFI